MIRVQNLRKHFGPVTAVEDVSFTAADGTVTGLLGPNGAGKTTSLRMIYGLIKPDAGTIQIDSHNVLTHPLAAQAALGVLPDQSGLYPRLTPREHIRYFGQLQSIPPNELEARMETWLQQLVQSVCLPLGPVASPVVVLFTSKPLLVLVTVPVVWRSTVAPSLKVVSAVFWKPTLPSEFFSQEPLR